MLSKIKTTDTDSSFELNILCGIVRLLRKEGLLTAEEESRLYEQLRRG